MVEMKARPTHHSIEVIRLAMPEFVDFLWKRLGMTEADYGPKQEIIEEMIKLFDDNFDHDGYVLAKELENNGWMVDEGLVDALGGSWRFLERAKNKLLKEWLKDTGLKPKRTLGEKVTWLDPNKKGTTYPAEIARISEEDGTYLIFVPDLGHVREGIGTHGLIVAWERFDANG